MSISFEDQRRVVVIRKLATIVTSSTRILSTKGVAVKRPLTFLFAVLTTVCSLGLFAVLYAQQDNELQLQKDPSALLAAYRHVEVASVSDAIEQLDGKRMYLSHRMQAIAPAKFAGFATTVRLTKGENHDAHALDGMLAAIDAGGKDSVYVMSIEDGDNIAGMGGLMGTAMNARGFAGAVVDGGVRDVAYLRKIGFPVYATGIVPSTSVGHYRFAGANIEITIDGVPIHTGDIITADQDGVVVVPREEAIKVLVLARHLDFKEHSMYAYIEQLGSIVEAVKKFGRL